MSDFDDPRLSAALRAYLTAADALDAAGRETSPDRERHVIDQAEAKALAAMALRRHLEAQGWVAPRTHASADDGH